MQRCVAFRTLTLVPCQPNTCTCASSGTVARTATEAGTGTDENSAATSEPTKRAIFTTQPQSASALVPASDLAVWCVAEALIQLLNCDGLLAGG